MYFSYLLSVIAGILPALIWLLFWRREDARRPEPKKLILLAFIAGGLAVPLVIPFQKYIAENLLGGMQIKDVMPSFGSEVILAIIAWAFIEEFMKFLLASISILWNKNVDEPIDPMIYLITVAVGFSAVENILFILTPILDGNIVNSLLTSNLRFIGASLVHIASSALVGFFLALSFYNSRSVRSVYALLGLILASLLHGLFNFFIIQGNNLGIFIGFILIWFAIIGILLIFEKAKRIHPLHNLKNI